MTEMRISALGAALAVAAAAIALLLLIALAPANAGAATIKMEGKKEKDLVFSGPESIKAGKTLKVANLTNPKKVGPHTFSLVEKKLVPKTKKESENCFAPGGLCLAIAFAHEFDPETEKIGKADVDAGKTGWDAIFDSVDEGATGDTWYTETKDEKTKRKVVAKAGTKLTYFCAVHPWMVDSIKVK